MSAWSLEAMILFVTLIAVLVFAVSRMRLERRRRNKYRRGPKS